jgi:hypothetical protein
MNTQFLEHLKRGSNDEPSTHFSWQPAPDHQPMSKARTEPALLAELFESSSTQDTDSVGDQHRAANLQQ